MHLKLSQIASGKKCKIIQIRTGDKKLLQKLLDMGFVSGEKINIIREAPLYDPMELQIHNYLLTMRKSEASLIDVELL